MNILYIDYKYESVLTTSDIRVYKYNDRPEYHSLLSSDDYTTVTL